MANRYAVNTGPGWTWDATAGTKWATTSGGAGGASVPTAADDVFLNAASGAGTVTTGTALQSVCRSLTCTGFTGTLALSNASPSLAIGDASGGAPTFAAGMAVTLLGSLSSIRLAATGDNGGAGWPITTAGKSLGHLTCFAAGGKWTLQDALTIGATYALSVLGGTLDTNGKAVSAGSFVSTGSTTRQLTAGASVITLTNTGTVWNLASTGLTLDIFNSTIVVSGATAAARTVATNGLLHGEIRYTVAASSGSLTITGSLRLRYLNVDTTVARTLFLPSGVGSVACDQLTLTGRAGQLLTVKSNAAGVAAGLATTHTDALGNVWVRKGNALVQQADRLVLPGVAGNYVRAEHAAGMNATDELEVVAHIVPDTWTPAASSIVMARYITAAVTDSAYICNRPATNASLRLVTIPASGAPASVTSSSTVSPNTIAADGVALWTKQTWRSSDGRVQFWTAPTAKAEPAAPAWAQLGVDRVGEITSLATPTSALLIGARGAAGTTEPYTGSVYRTIQRNLIGGAPVADFDGARQGFIGVSYVSFQDIAYMGCHWLYADNSTNVSGNSGINFAPLPATVKIHDGYKWRERIVKRHNGSAWIEVPASRMKRHDGATWVSV